MEELFRSFLISFFLVCGLPLLFVTVVSVLLSIVQAAMQVQEQTLGFLAKISLLTLLLVLFGGVAMGLLQDFFLLCYSSASRI